MKEFTQFVLFFPTLQAVRRCGSSLSTQPGHCGLFIWWGQNQSGVDVLSRGELFVALLCSPATVRLGSGARHSSGEGGAPQTLAQLFQRAEFRAAITHFEYFAPLPCKNQPEAFRCSVVEWFFPVQLFWLGSVKRRACFDVHAIPYPF